MSYEDVGPNDRVILKVPQAITAQKLRRGSSFIANDTYLDAEIFKKQFYAPEFQHKQVYPLIPEPYISYQANPAVIFLNMNAYLQDLKDITNRLPKSYVGTERLQ